jgi:hypothetical protein
MAGLRSDADHYAIERPDTEVPKVTERERARGLRWGRHTWTLMPLGGQPGWRHNSWIDAC